MHACHLSKKNATWSAWTCRALLNKFRGPKLCFLSSWTYMTQAYKFDGRRCIWRGASPRWTFQVSKTGLVLADGRGVNGFANLRGQISGFLVDGPIWYSCASS
jgi:hypothetical protein